MRLTGWAARAAVVTSLALVAGACSSGATPVASAAPSAASAAPSAGDTPAPSAATSAAPSAAPSVAAKPIKVIMIAFPAGDDYYFTIENAAKAEAAKLGVDLTIQKMPQYEAAAQIDILNAAIVARPDVIMVAPADVNSAQAILEKAKQQGIKIVLYDTTTRDPSVAATFVSADIPELGRMAGREFARQIGDRHGTVFYQKTQTAQPFLESMYQGWTEVLKDKPGLKFLAPTYSDWEPSKAGSQMAAILAGYPDLIGGFAGIFTDQQANTAEIRRAGKTGTLVVVGLDGAPANVKRLRDGDLQALVSVKAADYGTEAIRAAVAAAKGETLPAITPIGECVLLKDNLDDPANKPCLYELDTTGQ